MKVTYEKDILYIHYNDKDGKQATIQLDLPELQGSDEQVRWAREIRAQLIATRLNAKGDDGKGIEDTKFNLVPDVKEAIIYFLCRNTLIKLIVCDVTDSQKMIDEIGKYGKQQN